MMPLAAGVMGPPTIVLKLTVIVDVGEPIRVTPGALSARVVKITAGEICFKRLPGTYVVFVGIISVTMVFVAFAFPALEYVTAYST